jgi:hypothetical protein
VHRRILIILTVIAIFAAACGGGDDDTATPTTSATTTTAEKTTEPTTAAPTTTQATSAPATEAPASGAAGSGQVAIGDITWDFALTGDPREQCLPDIGGTFFVAMFKEESNGDQLALNITAQPDGRIVIQAGSPLISEGMWISDEAIYASFPDLDAGVSADVSISGNTITGTGTFYEDRSLRETLQTGDPYETGLVEGTFSATCP